MNTISILMPPVAFAIILAAVGLLSWGLGRLSINAKGNRITPPYACGEDMGDHMIQPDYGQFLPFAFFFTILHVTALMATTIPMATAGAIGIGVVYVLCALLGLYVLYAR